MAEVDDGYDSYYADRLWQLLPGVYRAQDSDDPGVTGPLQELVDRIGAQVAVVRRSIDRLWADQSIETCDDWVIPYIGDLLGRQPGERARPARPAPRRRQDDPLPPAQGNAGRARGDRPRRHRLGRARRRGLPPAQPHPPQPRPAGRAGPAAVRAQRRRATAGDAPAAASCSRTKGLSARSPGPPPAASPTCARPRRRPRRLALRRVLPHRRLAAGAGAVGHYGIPKLLVFLWRLQSFASKTGPRSRSPAAQDEYVFDPTGRRGAAVPAPAAARARRLRRHLDVATEWQVPGPLTQSLLQALQDSGTAPPPHAPYPGRDRRSPFYGASAGTQPVTIEVWPELGQFAPPRRRIPDSVSYQYGFPAKIGAGPYDRTLLGDPPPRAPERTSGGNGSDRAGRPTAARARSRSATPRTYSAGRRHRYPGHLAAGAGRRRAPSASGGAAAGPGQPRRPARRVDVHRRRRGHADARRATRQRRRHRPARRVRDRPAHRLAPPTREPRARTASGSRRRSTGGRSCRRGSGSRRTRCSGGAIGQLLIDHCVLGPVRTRNGGAVDSTSITDSVIQGLAPQPSAAQTLTAADVYDPELLAAALKSPSALSTRLLQSLPSAAQSAVEDYPGGVLPDASLAAILDGLNTLVSGSASIYDAQAFAGVPLTPAYRRCWRREPSASLPALNRTLLNRRSRSRCAGRARAIGRHGRAGAGRR